MSYSLFNRGKYWQTPPTLSDQQVSPVALDVNSNVQVNVVTSVLPTNASKDGTDASAAVPPAGAVGIRGWLSGIFTTLAVFLASNAGGYVRQDSTGTIAKESGGNLATIATDVAPLVASGAGGYVRQDSNGTIAKETGGNLDAIKTALTTGPVPISAAALPLPAGAAQETGNLASILSAVLATQIVKQSSNPAGGPQPFTITADVPLQDILMLQLAYTRATYYILAHLASEDGTMKFDDFDPDNTPDATENLR